MSESTNEILEITDSSINIEISPIQDNGGKRRLSEKDVEYESDVKKLCANNETEKLEESTSAILEEPSIEGEETVLDETVELDTVVCLDNTTKLHTSADKIEELHTSNESECILDEIEIQQEESPAKNKDEQPPAAAAEDKIEEEIPIESEEESIHEQNSESEDEDDIDDDDALMERVNSSLPLSKQVQNSEPIALDSTDDEEEDEADEENRSRLNDEEEDENSEDCQEASQSEEDDDEGENYEFRMKNDESNSHKASLRMRLLSYNPRYYYARVLVKKSVKYVWKKQLKKEDKEDNEQNKSLEVQNDVEITDEKKKCTNVQLPNDKQDPSDVKNDADVSMQNVDDDDDVEMKDEDDQNKNDKTESAKPTASNEPASAENKSSGSNDVMQEINDVGKSSQNHVNIPDLETHFLLNEIASFSVDEIMNKYVQRSNNDQSSTSQQPTLDEFSEELFFCLQQNKIEIQKVQQIWNEKVHLKFKIRELMERIRRHRAVNDIENFGFKPTQESQQSSSSINALISSKSSTTNSENEHFERSSKHTSESVNRLIQDVKANVLKKEHQRMDFAMNATDSYDENSSFALNPNMQSFGRQGQTIDVQSIINDFRSKNPQEIPRRGRRVKNSFECNLMNESQNQSPFIKSDKSNNVMKLNTPPSGFPEVSLVPVNNFYKNHSSTPASSSPFGQKSSLLQSILTKQQTTKSPIGYPPSSTLQRLLTAPERSFQSVSRTGQANTTGGHSTKVHNNGEITITPIAGTSRKQDFTMDDEEENSTEPPLVIDESEDFELNDRTRELICQGCRKNKALFMCAGCSRQWYCSKECQELAWNDHENSCF